MTAGRVVEGALACRPRADRVDYASFFGKPQSSRPPAIGSSSFRNMQRCSPFLARKTLGRPGRFPCSR